MNESDIQRQVIDYLRARRIFHWRNNVGGVYRNGRYVVFGVAGAGDIIGVLNDGRFLSVEIKAPGPDTTAKKRKEAQAAFRDAINTAGGVAIVARSVDDVMALFEPTTGPQARKGTT